MFAAVSPELPFLDPETTSEIVLFGAGLLALRWQIKRAIKQPAAGITPWPATWLDFGIWFWVVCCAALVGVSIFKLFFGDRGQDASDEFGLMLRAAAMHGALLAAQLVLLWQRRAWSPAPVNSVKMQPLGVLQEGIFGWLAAIPVIAVTAWGWQKILEIGHQQTAPLQPAVQFLDHASRPQQIILMVIFAVILAPINEELFFRAGLYRFIKSRLPGPYALIAINLLFAAAHSNLLTFVPLFALGILLTRLYERTGNIAPGMVFHALFNLANVVLILLFPTLTSPPHSP